MITLIVLIFIVIIMIVTIIEYVEREDNEDTFKDILVLVVSTSIFLAIMMALAGLILFYAFPILIKGVVWILNNMP